MSISILTDDLEEIQQASKNQQRIELIDKQLQLLNDKVGSCSDKSFCKEESKEHLISQNDILEQNLFEVADCLERETFNLEDLMTQNLMLKQACHELGVMDISKKRKYSKPRASKIFTPKNRERSPTADKSLVSIKY